MALDYAYSVEELYLLLKGLNARRKQVEAYISELHHLSDSASHKVCERLAKERGEIDKLHSKISEHLKKAANPKE